MTKNIRLMTVTALLAAVSIILSYFEIPIIPAFPFLKLDFAEVAVILCSFLFGFVPAVCAEAIRSVISLFITGTASAGVGTVFNFVLGVIFVFVYSFMFKRKNCNIWLSVLFTAIITTVIACALNFLVVVPIYKQIGMFPQGIATEYYIFAGALPLNLVKWISNALLAAVISESGIKRFVLKK